MQAQDKPSEEEATPLKDKLNEALTELRVVVPGVQALLGFQFAVMLTEEFNRLPGPTKWIHLVSLALIAVSAVLLMTPAAYHRIVERGEETERLHRFGTRMVLAAMIPLGLGVSGDFFVVARKITDSLGIAAAMSAGSVTTRQLAGRGSAAPAPGCRLGRAEAATAGRACRR